jgi:hypothetical protein
MKRWRVSSLLWRKRLSSPEQQSPLLDSSEKQEDSLKKIAAGTATNRPGQGF